MDLFKIAAALTLDSSSYEQGLNEAEGKANSFGSKLASGLSTAGKVLGGVMAAGAAGAAALTTQAVQGYADYEQLVGGVETLFGKSAGLVQGYADVAYKTAGLSANAYMETVTSFSASLLQSLGGDTEAAANYADMAIRDMSDNANKMGSSMESIQNAYQGFAKQNYTMLDNLKLGYGGTQSEMARLVEDAEKLNDEFKATRDENGDLTLSYADVVDAIHIVQDNMGITGTTAAEAGDTISGSLGSVKAAWDNLVVAMASDNANVDSQIEAFVESAMGMLGNMLPRIGKALQGVGKVLQKTLPRIVGQLPQIINDVLPELTNAALVLIESVITTLVENAPTILDTVLTAVETILTTIGEKLPELLPMVVQMILDLATTIIDHLPELLDAVLLIIEGLAQGILDSLPIIIEKLPEIISGIVDFLIGAIPTIIETGISLLTALIDDLPTIISSIVDALPELISGIIDGILSHLDEIIDAGIELLTSLIDDIPAIVLAIVEALPDLIDGIVGGILDHLPDLIDAGIELFVSIVENIPEIVRQIVEKLPELIEGIANGIIDLVWKIKDAGKRLLEGLWNGIKEKAEWLKNKIKEWAGGLLDGIKDFFGIHSPSRVFRDIIGKNLAYGLGEGISRHGEYAIDSMKQLSEDILGAADVDADFGSVNASSTGTRYGRVAVTQNIYAEKMSPSEVFEEAREQQERWLLLGV